MPAPHHWAGLSTLAQDMAGLHSWRLTDVCSLGDTLGTFQSVVHPHSWKGWGAEAGVGKATGYSEEWRSGSSGVPCAQTRSPPVFLGDEAGQVAWPSDAPIASRFCAPPSFRPLPLLLSQHPNQTWYLLVELKGISATLGFLSLIFLTEPQDSSMHLSRADSEASPAVSRCRRRIQCHKGGGQWRMEGEGHQSPRGSQGVQEGELGTSKAGRPWRRR